MTRVLNLTPHPVNIYREEEVVLTIPPSGTVARATMSNIELPPLQIDNASIPTITISYDGVEGLPDPDSVDFIIVSSIVASVIKSNKSLYDVWRGKILVPDTSPASVVRDNDGRILGVRRFIRY